MLVSQVVKLNVDAGFENDVQLGWYPSDPRSGRFARGFIFTDKAVDGKLSSIDILEKLKSELLYPSENRFVVIANYGHGKTHFALALANFFGLPAESETVQAVLTNIAHASPGRAQAFKSFRENRRPALVVILRGDQPAGIAQQYLTSLDSSMARSGLSSADLPHWFAGAEKYFASLTADQIKLIEEFFFQQGGAVDLAGVRRRLADRDPSVYSTCRAASAVLSAGLGVDFGGEVSLDELVTVTADTFCGEGKPYENLVILFDEFASFIRRVGNDARYAADPGLQDLLNGIANKRGKVVFVAFSQHDPDTVANNALGSQPAELRDSLSRELSRLPRDRRYQLHSSMETVLDSYLLQNELEWESLRQDSANALVDATDQTMTLFPDRYDDSRGWPTEKVAEILTKGCYPLHPVTTAALCSVDLRDVASTRTVLGFVKNRLDIYTTVNAVSHGEPTWVRPIELVDWFDDMLADTEYRQYKFALQQVGIGLTEEVHAVLKAIFLQLVVGLQFRRGFDTLISILTGLPKDLCRQTLEWLAKENGYVRYDDAQKAYVFWPLGAGGNLIEQEINSRIAGKKITNQIVSDMNAKWSDSRLRSRELQNIEWAYPKDFAAKQVLLTKDSFNTTFLLALASPYTYDERSGMCDGVRGCIVWLIPSTASELAWFRDNVQRVLDSLASPSIKYPIPIVVALCPEVRPRFEESVLRERAAADMDVEDRRRFGMDVYQETARRYARLIDDELVAMRSSPEIFVQAQYGGHAAVFKPWKDPGVVLRKCYDVAYGSRLPGFFTQYSDRTQALKTAVATVAKQLYLNRVASLNSPSGVTGDLIAKYLRTGGTVSWGILTHTDALKPPTNTHVLDAWNKMDELFDAVNSTVRVQDGFLALLNTPFGYTFTQATLVFCAWFGYNAKQLSLQRGAAPDSMDEHLPKLSIGAREFVCDLSDPMLTLRRIDQGAEARRIEKAIEEASGKLLSTTEAQDYQRTLKSFINTNPSDDTLAMRASAEVSALNSDFERLAVYTKSADSILARLARVNDLAGALNCAADVARLTRPTRYKVPDRIDHLSLAEGTRQNVTNVTRKLCARCSVLADLDQFMFNEQELSEARVKLISAHRPDLVREVETAQSALKAAQTQLVALRKDSEITAQLRALQPTQNIAAAREVVKRLMDMKPASEETKKMLEQKLGDARTAIKSAETYVTELTTKIEQAVSVKSLKQLHLDAISRRHIYEGVPELLVVIDSCVEDAEALAEGFQTIEGLSIEPRSEDEADHTAAKLSEVEDHIGGFASKRQLAAIQQLRTSLDEYVNQQRHAAVKWLDDAEHRASTTDDMYKVIELLARPPSWLPTTCKQRMDELRKSANDRLESNEVENIVYLFKKITDGKKRELCLSRLQQIIAGNEA